jgi:hypothetical protein
MLCENETPYKHKEIYYVWPIKAFVPDSPPSKHLNKITQAMVDFDEKFSEVVWNYRILYDKECREFKDRNKKAQP